MPNFDLELSTLRNKADTPMVEPLRRVLAEVDWAATMVVTWQRLPGRGTAACKYDPSTHRRVGYGVQIETDRPGRTLGNLVHELTHVAVNEAFDLDFVNYSNPDIITRLPLRRYDDSHPGYAQGASVEARQKAARITGQDRQREVRFDDLIIKACATLALDVDKRGKLLVDQFQYGRDRPHVEYDTVINQTLFWLYEWASEDFERTRLDRKTRPSLLDTPLFRTLSGLVTEAYNLREQGRLTRQEVWFNAPDLPQTTPGG